MKINKIIFDQTLSGVYFGESVAINSGDTSFIGAYRYNTSGTVFVYKKYDTEWGWNELTKINLNDQNPNEGFGFSVSTNNQGNILAVGSPFKNGGDGVVSIFTGNGQQWNKSYQISGILSGFEFFGFDLDLNSDGNRLIVGTNIYDTPTGKAYLYSGSGNNWNLITGFYKDDGLQRIDGSYKSYYGNKVGINSGNTVLIGSRFNNNSGAVFIYTGQNNVWVESQKLSGNYNSAFGESFYVNKNGNYILVGAPNNLNNSGTVDLYQKTGNSWQKTYSFSGNTNFLGKCLFINESGDFIFMSENNNSGTIYNYVRYNNQWYKNLTIKNPEPNKGLFFGNNFTVNNNYTQLLIGTPNFTYNQGAAYVYSYPWNNYQEYFAVNDIDVSGSNCICDEILDCSDCCGVTPSFTITTGYINNLNQFSADINILIKNNNCSEIYDIYSIYSNGIKIYNNIYQVKSFGEHSGSINLRNIKLVNNLLNLELKVQNLGKYYSYNSGIDINNY
jgi:hypothetical protein